MSFRKEEKIRIDKNKLVSLRGWMCQNESVELYKKRIVSSTYFDNKDLRMFFDSEEGTVPRKKIRVRSYTSHEHTQENSVLEVKISSVEGRYKTSTKEFDLKKIFKIGIFDHNYGLCKPIIRVSYLRSYYKVKSIRFTIDESIVYAAVDGGRESKFTIFDSEVAVEIKAEEFVPVEFLNQSFPFPRIRFSKYSRGISSLIDNGFISI